jgi:hypothetical protein
VSFSPSVSRVAATIRTSCRPQTPRSRIWLLVMGGYVRFHVAGRRLSRESKHGGQGSKGTARAWAEAHPVQPSDTYVAPSLRARLTSGTDDPILLTYLQLALTPRALSSESTSPSGERLPAPGSPSAVSTSSLSRSVKGSSSVSAPSVRHLTSEQSIAGPSRLGYQPQPSPTPTTQRHPTSLTRSAMSQARRSPERARSSARSSNVGEEQRAAVGELPRQTSHDMGSAVFGHAVEMGHQSGNLVPTASPSLFHRCLSTHD